MSSEFFNKEQKKKKGDYDLVIPLEIDGNNEMESTDYDDTIDSHPGICIGDDDNDEDDDESSNKHTTIDGSTTAKKMKIATASSSSSSLPLSSCWENNKGMMMKSWISDDQLLFVFNRSRTCSRLFEGVECIRFLKFIIHTFLSIIVFYWFIRWTDLEHDRFYRLSDMVLYESDLIIMDCTLFFVVGRMFKLNGVDNFAWIGVTILANLYTSLLPLLPMMRYSASLFSMHCLWPASLWLFAGVLVVVCGMVVGLHFRYTVRHKLVCRKLFETGLCILLFLVPKCFSPYFHFHHWFAGWFIGMHCNFHKKTWSTLTMAWCWGLYINGIASWGRDPTLTCGYGHYLSWSLGCPYLKCYTEGIHKEHSNITRMAPADWRDCSSVDYIP